MDETLALPSEKAAEIVLRTQQLIAYETGVANVSDPLGGSWFLESLTDQLENDAEKYFEDIEKNGVLFKLLKMDIFKEKLLGLQKIIKNLLMRNNYILLELINLIKKMKI